MDRIGRRTYLAMVAGAMATAVVGRSRGERGHGTDGYPPGTPPGGAPGDGQTSERATSNRPDESRSATESTHEYAVGDRIVVGDLHVVVADVRLVTDGVAGPDGDVLEATGGAQFAVVDVAVQHAGRTGVVTVGEALTVALVDANGERYERLPGLEPTAREVTAGRLAPGEVLRGDLVYVVPGGTDRFVVRLDSPAGETVTVPTGTYRTANTKTRLRQAMTPVLDLSQHAERAGVEVRVESLELGNDLGGLLQAEEGDEVVAVGVTVENHSGRERTLEPGQMQLKDEWGRVHDAERRLVEALVSPDGVTLSDGEAHDGELVYRIGDGRDELYWTFDFGPWDEESRVAWRLR